MLSAARHRAKKLGLEFNLDISDIVIPQFCPITGLELGTSNQKGGEPNSPTLDRIDNTKGYIKGNISVISKRANSAKSNMTLDQIERLIKYMKGELC